VAGKKPRVIVLVGPTGEGKTTTIAKLAAAYRKKDSAEHEHQIYMVTIDQFRVAAGRQVETYAEALNVRYAAANSAEDIRGIVSMNPGMDALFIDTAGFSPNDFEHIGSMRKILDIPELCPETYLTVSAAKTAGALRNIFTSYEIFNCRAVIVTKVDEVDRIGNVLSVLHEKDKSVAYITTGQKVSRDIKRAEALDFLKKLADIKIRSEQDG
jgi:flagellar biosynthesis protein FlhF